MRKEINKWKFGFWIYFIISIVIIFYLFAIKNSLEVSLAFTKIAKIQTEKDLKIVSEIVNNSALTKTEILDEIERDKFYKIEKVENKKIELERVTLIFEKEKLRKIEIKKSEIGSLLN
jgi:uncharacterized protein YpmS